MEVKHFIGIDGGGTKTEMIAVNVDEEHLLAMHGGPCNPKSVTDDGAHLTLMTLLDACYDTGRLEPRDCLGICLGIAGIDDRSERERIAEYIRRYYEGRGASAPSVYATNDAEIALAAALGSHMGIIAIAGTGSIVYGISESGHEYRAGGWGHLLGDAGSGYDIGLQALRTVMRSHDGVEPPTLLTELVLEKLGLQSPPELRSWIYQPAIHKQHIADMAEVCIRAADADDHAAVSIITRAATELAMLTGALRNKEESLRQAAVAMAGSVFKHSALYARTYREQLIQLSGPATLVAAERRPAHGAAWLAASRYASASRSQGT